MAKEELTKKLSYLKAFFDKNILFVGLLILALQVLIVGESIPYLNVFLSNRFLIGGIIGLFILIFFRDQLNYSNLIKITIAIFAIAIPFNYFLTNIEDLLGFITFTFIFTSLIKILYKDREELREFLKQSNQESKQN